MTQKVSIILPTYNERGNIGPLIHTLMTLADHEIIVVDDSSPDGTGVVVVGISAGDGRVRLLKRGHKMGLPCVQTPEQPRTTSLILFNLLQ